MTRPIVSIIIANYNYGHFLAEAIESALAQTWQPLEVIVIDDGSTDDSLALAGRYPLTVLSQPNQGVSAARNNGAARAAGEYLFFLDADDILLPDAIERLVMELERAGPQAGFAYGRMQYFGEKNGLFTSHAFEPSALARENYIPACSLIRRSAFDQVGGWDRGFALREDWELFVRLWHAGYSGAFHPEVYIRCRKHRPRATIRGKNKQRKNLSLAKLVWLYPGFFWLQLLKHPLRFLYYVIRYKVPSLVGHYGPTLAVTIVSRPGMEEKSL